MDKHIPEIVNEGTWIKRRTNPGPNVLMLGVHQKMPQRRFPTNGHNKNNLLALFVEFWNYQNVRITTAIPSDSLSFAFLIIKDCKLFIKWALSEKIIWFFKYFL